MIGEGGSVLHLPTHPALFTIQQQRRATSNKEKKKGRKEQLDNHHTDSRLCPS